MRVVDQNSGTFVGSSMFASHLDIAWPNWLKVDKLDLQIRSLESQTIFLRNDFSELRERLRSLDWSAFFERYWSEYYYRLLWQAQSSHVDGKRLQELQSLALEDIEKACHLLVAEVHRVFTESLAKLRRQLRTTRSLKVQLLRFASRACKFKNTIVLQRRFYLTHGSHPIENSVCLNGDRLSRLIGGCTPAFLQ